MVHNVGVSKNRVPPNHPILIGFSIINHPFWGTLFLETPICCWFTVFILLSDHPVPICFYPKIGIKNDHHNRLITICGVHPSANNSQDQDPYVFNMVSP